MGPIIDIYSRSLKNSSGTKLCDCIYCETGVVRSWTDIWFSQNANNKLHNIKKC